jgi:hypothetical protein
MMDTLLITPDGAFRQVRFGLDPVLQQGGTCLEFSRRPSVLVASASENAQNLYRVAELSIGGIHAGLEGGRFTCRELVQRYLDRIEAYDQKEPALNAIVVVNPRALERAGTLEG